MTMHNLSRLGLCLALAAGVSACSQQSTYHRQDLALAPSWQQPDDGLTRQQAGLWWQGFHDPALDQLVEAVLAANPDMQVAGLRLRSALLGSDLADTNLTPSVNASLTPTATRI
jgi:outer membrane protein TolC